MIIFNITKELYNELFRMYDSGVRQPEELKTKIQQQIQKNEEIMRLHKTSHVAKVQELQQQLVQISKLQQQPPKKVEFKELTFKVITSSRRTFSGSSQNDLLNEILVVLYEIRDFINI